MRCSALLYAHLWLTAVNSEMLPSKHTIRKPREANQDGITNGCLLPRQPMGGSFELDECAGSSCNVSPGKIVRKGSYLTYKCNDGYTLVGNAVSYCHVNAWQPLPSCVKTCPVLRSDSVNFDCRYNGKIVSCDSATVPGTTATLACKDWYNIPFAYDPGYRELICLGEGVWDRTVFHCNPECGTVSPRGSPTVVNGITTRLGEFPWHVGVYKSTQNFEQICGGSLISPSVAISAVFEIECRGQVMLDLDSGRDPSFGRGASYNYDRISLSAAHCFYDDIVRKLESASKFAVASGKYFRLFNYPEPFAQNTTLRRIDIPNEFSGVIRSYADDIAVLHLATPFTMTPFVRPICMDWDNKYEREQLQNGNSGKVMGWGVNEKGVSSSELRAINLPYVDFQTCFTAVPEDFKNFITTDKFCAGYLNGSSVCNGDSGGGLSFELDGRWILRGVVSGGPAAQFMCNTNYYTTFTKVGSYLRFIRNSTFKPRNFPEEKDATTRVITPMVSMDDPTTGIPASGCILPEQPTGGSFQLGSCTGQCNVTTGLRVPINTSLVYRCNENYMLQGNSVTICKNNGWYLPPTCSSKYCPPFDSDSVDVVCKYKGVTVSCKSALIPGSTATLSCKSWYNTPPDYSGHREVTCLESGDWDGFVLHCIPDCGMAEANGNPLIIDGSNVYHGGFPWHVGIYEKQQFENFEKICAGTLVSPDLVVSAAQCFYDEFERRVMKADRFSVAAGKYYQPYNRRELFAQTSQVQSIDVSDTYLGRMNNFANDIALLRLESPFTLTLLVRPVCVDWRSRYAVDQLQRGKIGKTVGWGTSAAGILTNELQEINLQYIAHEECVSAALKESRLRLTADKFCANYHLNGSNRCASDGGEGLSFKSYGRWYLRGIVSLGPTTGGKCNNNNYVTFTNVGNFTDWIREAYVGAGSGGNDSPIGYATTLSAIDGLTTAFSGSGCILPRQPIGGSFKLGSCMGLCDIVPGTTVPIGSFLIYQCNEGYTVDGNNVTICYNNAWYLPPTCLRKASGDNCPALESESVDINCKYRDEPVSCQLAIAPWTKANLACKSFYKIPFADDPGYREITCLENGTWNRPMFDCVPECGTAIPDGTQLTVNGSTVIHGRFPWVVEIYDESFDRCEGTLISPNLVISTAYWFGNETEYNVRNTSEYMVFVGKYLPDYDTLESYAQKSRVKRIDVAADYTGKQGNYDNNVALIHVETPFTMTILVRPICIHWDNKVDRGELGNLKSEKVVGWRVPAAATVINGSHTIGPSYISHEECLVRVGQRYKHYLTADTFCAIYCSNGSSVCKGDVYASAFGYESRGLWYLLGVKKINISPEHSPRNWAAVFSNVGYYLDWVHAANVSAG